MAKKCYKHVYAGVHFDNYLAASGMSFVGIISIFGCSFLLMLSLFGVIASVT